MNREAHRQRVAGANDRAHSLTAPPLDRETRQELNELAARHNRASIWLVVFIAAIVVIGLLQVGGSIGHP